MTVSWMFLIEHTKNTKESFAFTTKRAMVSTPSDPQKRVPRSGLTVRTAMIEEAVDLVAGDFLKGTSWRRKVGDERLTDCIIEHAISNALPPLPPGPTPLWVHRCVRFPLTPQTSKTMLVRIDGAFKIEREEVGLSGTDWTCHYESWIH